MTSRKRLSIWAAALVAPPIMAALASVAGDLVPNTSAALVLVLVVVVVATAGDRATPGLAALSASASFDHFLTAPYHRFAIADRSEIELALLLLVVGLAIGEIVHWGRRQQALSNRRAGYLAGVAGAVALVAEGQPTSAVVGTIGRMISDVLDLDACRFVPSDPPDPTTTGRPILVRDGTVWWQGRQVDVDREGLPGLDVIELPAGHGPDDGTFLLTASTTVRRPDREQLLIAVTLAGQVTVEPAPQLR